MKHFTTLLGLLLFLSFTLKAQYAGHISSDPDGMDGVFTEYYGGDFHLDRATHRAYNQTDMDPGVFPEGDYMGNCIFTPDGQKVLLTNRVTDNITVWNWADMELLANIQVGEYPSCLAANDELIIVGCQFSDSVYLIDQSDYSILAVLPTGEQPCSIELSPDGTLAYVACDIDDVCEVIDLVNFEVIGEIENFPIYLHTISMAVQVSRSWEKYNGFLVSPDGSSLAIAYPDLGIIFFSTSTYQQTDIIPIENARAIGLSGDGNYLTCAANPNNECNVHQIDLSDLSIKHTVVVTGNYLATMEIVANADGSKAYIGTGNNTSTLIRFNTEDFVSFSNTYTAFWLGVTYDHLYAISGQNRFSVIDFENETIADQYPGLNQSFGAVSPVAYHVFAHDPLRYEGAYFFDCSDPESIEYKGSRLSGEDPEGDTPGTVAVSNDRTRAVSINNLSYNCSVIDLETMEVMGSIPLGESCYDVRITPDGQYAVCGGYDENTVKIIDLNTSTLVKSVYTGQRPMVVELSPDGQFAYIGNIKQNTLSVIDLDGANSSLVTSVSCGVIGVYNSFYGIRSDVEVSPDGSTVLVAASFDDQLKVFDTQSNQIVASFGTGDFPLSVAFNADGNQACVVNTFDHTVDIVTLDGASSSVTAHFNVNGDYPVDVAYNPADGYYYVCSPGSQKIFVVDPNMPGVTETIYPGGNVFHIEFLGGEAIMQYQDPGGTNNRVVYGEEEFLLPASAAPLALNEVAGMVGVPMPGPDFLSFIDFIVMPFIAEPGQDSDLSVYPNPARESICITSPSGIDQAEIYDLQGRLMIRADGHPAKIDVSHLDNGTYIVRTTTGSLSMSRTFIKE